MVAWTCLAFGCLAFQTSKWSDLPCTPVNKFHDDVIKLKHFPRYWPFVRGIHRWQRPVTRSFDVCFDLHGDLHLNKRLCKQSGRRWFETPSRSLWRPCNARVPCQHMYKMAAILENLNNWNINCQKLVTYQEIFVSRHPFHKHGQTFISVWISNYIHYKVWWNYLSIPKLQRCDLWCLGIDM